MDMDMDIYQIFHQKIFNSINTYLIKNYPLKLDNKLLYTVRTKHAKENSVFRISFGWNQIYI